RLFIDGALQATRLDGRAMPLDPGSHEIRVELADGTSAKTTVLLREGEARRRIVLGEEPPPPPPERARPEKVYEPAAWIPLATVATLGTIVFAGLAGAGKAKENELLEECAPFCTEEEDAEMRSLYLGADVALGIGAAGAVGLALYFAIAAANAPDPRPPAAMLIVAPDASGLVIGARIALPTP
ncbi:MAG: hypothetical protein HOV80_05220, partial [Polyangiaceae bacterium]|nr:hypothetical protein [Polyangiaceae bacterium]